MRYYVIDDNLSTTMTLVDILESWEIGRVCGYNTEPVKALEEILDLNPDIVLVDMLMGGMDGISLVQKVKEKNSDILFVMLSKVSDKEMIQSAYNAGIEFFINKPINKTEVKQVLSNVSEKIELRKAMGTIKSVLNNDILEKAVSVSEKNDSAKNADNLFGALGMLGERGTKDIKAIYSFMLKHNCSYNKNTLQNVAKLQGDNGRNMEQRMRRAIKKGLNNAAMEAIDDFYGEISTVYANYVFEFSMVKEEMKLIKGESKNGGRVNIAKFIEGLVLYNDSLK